ncbi:dienelactone hydrolase family protein [Sphingobacterium chuzhouense]|jgi:dienelactone hydrolase|uniref:Dienelactone hydrolase domain-containing protein n=1 Tax=Sphingobacterium chuzhouense TaxID=1742264 RepID=A0ABR7XUP4_9SPHI|nr:alpha/beta hydrolase family protein [Sphingobacterium chuzhouense]MBD1422775.1 hypothetical protein [Sphingobacterium chuzhouense]
MIKNTRNSNLLLLFLIIISSSLKGQEKTLTKEEDDARIDSYERQLKDYLVQYLVDGYEERSSRLWNRDYSSGYALERSVEPNRRRWKQVLHPPILEKTGAMKKVPYEVNGIRTEWVTLPLGAIVAEGILAFPKEASKDNPVPLIIAQHGIGSGPETPFENGKSYHAYAKGLLEAGFAVLAPMNLRSIERRNNIERYARLAKTSIPGIEFSRMQHLLDVVLEDERIDGNRIGMWGVSLGGMATMFWMPLEPRIKAGIVSAWFNERRNKMVVPDERYSAFIITKEDYVYVPGWLEEFSDDDVVSMIAPRPLQIQHGKKDRIAHWPQVMEEYERAKIHYQKLGIENQIDMVMHEGGHEAIVEPGVAFFKKWLAR